MPVSNQAPANLVGLGQPLIFWPKPASSPAEVNAAAPGTTPVPDFGDRSQAPTGHFWQGNRLRINTNHPGPAHDLVSLADVRTWQADRNAQEKADRLKAANATR